MKKIKLNKNEKAIEKNILSYKPISAKEHGKIIKIIKKANEKKNISLRVNTQDLNLLRVRAEKEGIPYQTFISSILHKFVTEQLLDQKEIIKSIQLLNQNS
ncbi:MAG: antitoxin [Candidatus Omnitrophica bacterium]|nr:antitoxin [Candidatus Omnitrophota bacterium]